MASFEVTHGGSRFQIDAPDETSALDAFRRVIGSAGSQSSPQRDQGVLGTVDAVVRGFADTATFGMMDEIAAGAGALTGIGGKFGDYEGNLKRQRATDKADEEQHFGARTTGQVAGGVGTGLGMARAGLLASPQMAGSRFLARAPVAAAEGAVLGAAYGLGSGEGGPEQRLKAGAEAMPAGAVLGTIGEGAAPYIARGVEAIANRIRTGLNPADLGSARAQLGQLLGMDPATIPDSLATDFAQRAQRTVDIPAAARGSAAGEFNIPLLRGQATRNMEDLGFEEAARNEARGVLAGNTVRAFDDRQRQAIGAAQRDIAERLDQGRPVSTTSQNELSQEILDGLRQAETRSRQSVREAYEAAEATGTTVRADAVRQAGPSVRKALEENGFVLTEGNNPYGTQALREVEDIIGTLSRGTSTPQTGESVVGVSLQGLEQVRKRLLSFANNAGPEDARAVRAVRSAFDDWLDDAAERGLLNGTPQGVELYKAARAARREHGARFESNLRQPDADAGRAIERMIETDVTPVEVANYLMGSAKAGERGVSVRIAARLRDILGADSPEFGALKQAAWHRLTTSTAEGLPVPGPEAAANRILQFAAGKGEPFARILYSPEEIGLMRRYAVALQQTVTPRNVRNPSGSGYEAARALQAAGNAVASLIGGAAGGTAGAMGARIGTSLLGEGRGFLRARRSVNGPPLLPYDPLTRGAIAGGAAGLSGSQFSH